MSKPIKVLILGAAGRDFHNFNTFFKFNKTYEVVCFTAEQIPGIDSRMYPKELSGPLYPKGIPIYPEKKMLEIIAKEGIQETILAYSDLSNNYVMDKASTVMAAGSDFKLMGSNATQIKCAKPVIAICAVRTGVGKSQTTRAVVENLKKLGKKVVVIRHPMPYGDLAEQACQRFETVKDLDKHKCTIEEREEYELHIENGTIVYAGVDYEQIIRSAEKEADVVIWDGGNNDIPFYKTDLHFVLADPHRAGHEITYYPGQTNCKMADVLLIAKCNTAKAENIQLVEENLKKINTKAKIIKVDSVITCEKPEEVKGKKVVIIEDGPTLTHGEMKYGAGTICAQSLGCTIVDPKPFVVGTIKSTFEKYTHVKDLIPAMGYSKQQIQDLADSIDAVPCDIILSGTPTDLKTVLTVKKQIVRVKYDYKDNGEMEGIIKEFVKKFC